MIDNERLREWLCDIKVLLSNPIEMQYKRHSGAYNGLKGLIKWVMELCKKSLKEKIHVFCLDFASAMLSNIIHTTSTL